MQSPHALRLQDLSLVLLWFLHPQEDTADELEEAYRGEIWNPAKGHTKEHKQGITAARVDLRTMTNEYEASSLHPLCAP